MPTTTELLEEYIKAGKVADRAWNAREKANADLDKTRDTLNRAWGEYCKAQYGKTLP